MSTACSARDGPGLPVPQSLAPITLAELAVHAELSTRVERKYVLTRADANVVCSLLPAGTRVLEIDGRRSFRYASVYFDTPSRDVYLATAQHRRRRFKVRTRQYLDSGELFIEVKTHRGRFTIKDREPYDHADSLTPAAAAHVDGSLRAAGVGIDTATLGPALRTSYWRTTLYLPESGSRVTFDTGLSFSNSSRVLEFPEVAIVETKTAGAPTAVDHLLWSLGIRPVRFSKFGTGLAEIQPELPHARWSRLMRRRFASPPRPVGARPRPTTGATQTRVAVREGHSQSGAD